MKKLGGRVLLFSVLCFLSSVISGCGYTTRSIVSAKYRTIYITPFENKVNITNSTDAENKYRLYRPTIETDITRAVNNWFLFDGSGFGLSDCSRAFLDFFIFHYFIPKEYYFIFIL